MVEQKGRAEERKGREPEDIEGGVRFIKGVAPRKRSRGEKRSPAFREIQKRDASNENKQEIGKKGAQSPKLP